MYQVMCEISIIYDELSKYAGNDFKLGSQCSSSISFFPFHEFRAPFRSLVNCLAYVSLEIIGKRQEIIDL